MYHFDLLAYILFQYFAEKYKLQSAKDTIGDGILNSVALISISHFVMDAYFCARLGAFDNLLTDSIVKSVTCAMIGGLSMGTSNIR